MQRFIRSKLLTLFLFAAFFAPQAAEARPGPDGFADLAEKLLPAVVNISTTQTITSRDDMQDFDFEFPPGSPFEDFFRDFLEKNRDGQKDKKPHKRKSTSLGSGFIIDPAGYIVTNNHVIQDADEITIILQDNTNLTASVVGRDKKTDLAVLKVEAKKSLPYVPMGDSDKSRVGDWILAIGNPFGLGGTVTTGIISARARDINSGPYDDFLQTDAPINRGNSGGPMFNMEGEVIGINTAIFSPSGGSVGIGFAIPSTLAKGVIDQLKATGHTQRGWLGVRIQAVTPEIAQSLNLGKPHGALVSSITKGSPAADAKFLVGDVVVSYDGKDVEEMQRLPRMVAETAVDKTVDVGIIRKGEKKTLHVKVGKLDVKDDDEDGENDNAPTKEPAGLPAGTEELKDMGLSVAPLSDVLRKKYEIGKEVAGIVVVDVSEDGLAAERDIEEGDVISEASQKEIKEPKDLIETLKKAQAETKPVLLLVDRKGDLRFVAVKLDKSDKAKEKKK